MRRLGLWSIRGAARLLGVRRWLPLLFIGWDVAVIIVGAPLELRLWRWMTIARTVLVWRILIELRWTLSLVLNQLIVNPSLLEM